MLAEHLAEQLVLKPQLQRITRANPNQGLLLIETTGWFWGSGIHFNLKLTLKGIIFMFCITETPQILLHYPTWEAFVRLKGRHLARPSPPAFLTIAHPSGLCQALEFPPHFKTERAVCRTLTSHFHDLLVRALLTRSLLVINITQDPSYHMRK